jgi:hypothetical protein
MGRVFDDRGNRMSPSHSRKGAVLYGYYVFAALIQGQPQSRRVRRHRSHRLAAYRSVDLASGRGADLDYTQGPTRHHPGHHKGPLGEITRTGVQTAIIRGRSRHTGGLSAEPSLGRPAMHIPTVLDQPGPPIRNMRVETNHATRAATTAAAATAAVL